MQSTRRVERVQRGARVDRLGRHQAAPHDRCAGLVHPVRYRVVRAREATRRDLRRADPAAEVGLAQRADELDVVLRVTQPQLAVDRDPGRDQLRKVGQAELAHELDGELHADRLEGMVLAEAIGHERLSPDQPDPS